MNEYSELSENELKVIFDKVNQALEEKQLMKRTHVLKEIENLASSINVTVTISDNNSKTKKNKISRAKYCNPDNKSQTWSGRGKPPVWMRTLIQAGHDKSEFLI